MELIHYENCHGPLSDENRCFECRDMHANRLPTTHQLHAATPPLLDLLAALHWMQSGINWSRNALTCTACTITQDQSAMLCFAAVENCHIKLTHALIAKPLMFM